MTEMQQALALVRGNMGLHVQQFSGGTLKGRFGFIGSVPSTLKYIATDDVLARIARFGAGLYRGKYTTVSFTTAQDAVKAATDAGYAVCSSDTCSCRSLGI